MVYRLLSLNEKFDLLLNTAIKYSSHIGFLTIKHLHRKDCENSYLNFIENIKLYECSISEFIVPRYSGGQKPHVYSNNKVIKNAILNIPKLEYLNGFDYPIDISFYNDKRVWLRYISEENYFLINSTFPLVFEKLKSLGFEFLPVNNTNNIWSKDC